jgi:hypothetical protein
MTIQAIQLKIYSSPFGHPLFFPSCLPALEVKGRQAGTWQAGRQGREASESLWQAGKEAADRKLVVPLFVGRMEATRRVGIILLLDKLLVGMGRDMYMYLELLPIDLAFPCHQQIVNRTTPYNTTTSFTLLLLHLPRLFLSSWSPSIIGECDAKLTRIEENGTRSSCPCSIFAKFDFSFLIVTRPGGAISIFFRTTNRNHGHSSERKLHLTTGASFLCEGCQPLHS